MKLSVREFARLTGVSVRTLHYYDEIGLLKPEKVAENGYRYYGEASLSRMQEILFYRELDFPLKTVADIISSPDYDKKKALDGQKKLLLLKKQRLERIIAAIDSAGKGETMDLSAFDTTELDSAREQYKEEARARWGDTAAYKEHKEKTASYTAKDWSSTEATLNAILSEFAAAKAAGSTPASPEVHTLVEKLKSFITETQYTCTNEILASLGRMYVSDPRFTANIDKHGEGTAGFISDAVAAYCK